MYARTLHTPICNQFYTHSYARAHTHIPHIHRHIHPLCVQLIHTRVHIASNRGNRKKYVILMTGIKIFFISLLFYFTFFPLVSNIGSSQIEIIWNEVLPLTIGRPSIGTCMYLCAFTRIVRRFIDDYHDVMCACVRVCVLSNWLDGGRRLPLARTCTPTTRHTHAVLELKRTHF